QAEDGIRDLIVTGVQTCALPILKPLKLGFQSIRSRFLDHQVAMLHGRMTAADKEATMQRFKAGEIDILVSTTVIEVGIDVPNARSEERRVGKEWRARGGRDR